MKLYLARHGETDWNIQRRIQGRTDTPLNEKGMRQAGDLVDQIVKRQHCIEEIYSSGQERAKQTAYIVGERLKVPVIIKPGLEEMNLGKWEGYTWNQVKELFPEEYGKWHQKRRYNIPPGGESYQQLLERLIPALLDIIEEGKEVLIVSHSAVIMTLMSYVYDKPFEDMARNFKTGNAEIVDLDHHMIKPLQG